MRSHAGKPDGSAACRSAGTDGSPVTPHWMYAAATRSINGVTSSRATLGRMRMRIALAGRGGDRHHARRVTGAKRIMDDQQATANREPGRGRMIHAISVRAPYRLDLTV